MQDYPTSHSWHQLPQGTEIIPLKFYGKWTIETFYEQMEVKNPTSELILGPDGKRSLTWEAERKAFSRYISKDTNFHSVWNRALKYGNLHIAMNILEMIRNEWDEFCFAAKAPARVRACAINFANRYEQLAVNHFSDEPK